VIVVDGERPLVTMYGIEDRAFEELGEASEIDERPDVDTFGTGGIESDHRHEDAVVAAGNLLFFARADLRRRITS